MPRGDPDTATSGFFISVGDQPSLDFAASAIPTAKASRHLTGDPRHGRGETHLGGIRVGEKLTPPILISRVRLLSGERSEQR